MGRGKGRYYQHTARGRLSDEWRAPSRIVYVSGMLSEGKGAAGRPGVTKESSSKSEVPEDHESMAQLIN